MMTYKKNWANQVNTKVKRKTNIKLDLRKDILQMLSEGKKQSEIAEELGMKPSAINEQLKRMGIRLNISPKH